MLTAMTHVPHRGVAFENGDDFIIVPPLTTGQIRDNSDKFQMVMESTDPKPEMETTKERMNELLDIKLDLILLSVKRNYPEATLEDIRDFATLENLNSLISAAFGFGSGAKVKESPKGE